MSPRSTLHVDRTGRYLWGVLVLTLLLSAVLAWEAQTALRTQRRAAEVALRDYAGFASWEFRRQMAGRLESAPRAAAMVIQMGLQTGAVDRAGSPGRALREQADRTPTPFEWCACDGVVHDFFSIDLRTGIGFVQDRRALPEVGALALVDTLIRSQLTDARQNMGSHEVVLDRAGAGVIKLELGPAVIAMARLPADSDRMLVFSITLDGEGAATRAAGYVITVPAFVSAAAADVLGGAALLPPSLTAGSANSDVLLLAVHDTARRGLYASDRELPTSPRAVDTLRTSLGDFVVAVAVRPEVADRLLIGGLPRSRLPLIAGLFALTLMLTVIAFVQTRRREELHRLRGDFISGTSHELRTPLSQITLFSELLETKGFPPERRAESLRIIREESQRLTYLVENILRFARTEREPEQMRLEEHDVADTVRTIVDAFAPLARARGALLRINAPLTAPFAILDLDATRHVLLNVLDNAVKYGPRRQIITVSFATAADTVQVVVDDEGPGIPEAERGRVFEPYRRLDRDRNSAVGGSGIGLAIVRRLMLAQRGHASIAASPGGGTRVVLTFVRDAAVPDEQMGEDST